MVLDEMVPVGQIWLMNKNGLRWSSMVQDTLSTSRHTVGTLWAHTGPNHDWSEVLCPQSIESQLLSTTTQDFIRLSSLAFVLNSEHQKSFWQS